MAYWAGSTGTLSRGCTFLDMWTENAARLGMPMLVSKPPVIRLTDGTDRHLECEHVLPV